MPAIDKFQGQVEQRLAPAMSAETVTPDDNNELVSVSRAVYVGTGGNLSVVMYDKTTALLKNIPSGTLLPLAVRQVKATNTTAADIVSLS